MNHIDVDINLDTVACLRAQSAAWAQTAADEIELLRSLLRRAYPYVDTSKEHTFFKEATCPACQLVAEIDAALPPETVSAAEGER